jgi:hypothetical protein
MAKRAHTAQYVCYHTVLCILLYSDCDRYLYRYLYTECVCLYVCLYVVCKVLIGMSSKTKVCVSVYVYAEQ